VSPVVTLAVGTAAAAARSNGSSGVTATGEAGSYSNHATHNTNSSSSTDKNCSSSSSSSSIRMVCRHPPGTGVGKLLVVESQLMGGSTAVRCGGSGRLRNVRAIYETHSKAPYFWLEVDSADGHSTAAAAAVAAMAAAAEATEPPAAAAAAAVIDVEGGSDASILLQQRSKAWQQRQQQVSLPAAPIAAAAAIGGPSGCPTVGVARIQAVLGQHSINPASLAAHLTGKQQLQQETQQQQGQQ